MLRGLLHPAATWFMITIYCTENSRKTNFWIFYINVNKYIQAKLHPTIKRISNMYMYSNIVEHFPVSNSQLPIMGLFQIESKFQQIGYWVFNPPIYVRVRKKIKTITINNSTVTGKEFSIQDDVVTCRLNFCRRPVLVSSYISNNDSNFDYLWILKQLIYKFNFTRQPFPNERMVLIFWCSGEPPGTNIVRV